MHVEVAFHLIEPNIAYQPHFMMETVNVISGPFSFHVLLI